MLDTQVLADSPPRGGSALPAPFACSWTNGGDEAACVRLTGELDIATSPKLVQTLRAAQRRASLVVVDLRQVAFADSSAVHALVNASIRARRERRRLIVLRGSAHVDRIFALVRICDAVEVVDLDAVEAPVVEVLGLAPKNRACRVHGEQDRLDNHGT